jgi:hypothetical protein
VTPEERALAIAERATASQQAGEAIGTLNIVTLPADGAPGLEYPSDVCQVIGDLKFMAQRLPQLLDQLKRWLYTEAEAGRVGHDQGTDPWPSVHWAGDGLQVARDGAKALEHGLGRAHNAAAHLTGKDSSESKEGAS